MATVRIDENSLPDVSEKVALITGEKDPAHTNLPDADQNQVDLAVLGMQQRKFSRPVELRCTFWTSIPQMMMSRGALLGSSSPGVT